MTATKFSLSFISSVSKTAIRWRWRRCAPAPPLLGAPTAHCFFQASYADTTEHSTGGVGRRRGESLKGSDFSARCICGGDRGRDSELIRVVSG